MRDIPTYWASGVNPRVWIRSAWIEPATKRVEHLKLRRLAIGDAVALEFDDHKLVCTPWPTRANVLNDAEVSAYALAPFGVYARWMPKDTTLDDLELSRRIGLQLGEPNQKQGSRKTWPIPCNGVWYDKGRISDHLPMSDSALTARIRWDFEFKNNGLLTTPEFGTSTWLHSLAVCNTFNLVELMAVPNNERATVSERWCDFSKRYPPRYPTDPRHAWGWLLPDAPNDLKANGFRFKSVMAYALNPILRRRAASGQSNESPEVAARMAQGIKHLMLQNKEFARLVMQKSVPVDLLAAAAPQDHESYWRVLLEARQQAP
jgi:hypothetical protein